MVSVRRKLNKEATEKAERKLIGKVKELEKAKAVVRNLEKEIKKIQGMDLTDLIDYLD